MSLKRYIATFRHKESCPALVVLVLGHAYALWSILFVYSYAQFKWVNSDVANIFLVAKRFTNGQLLFANHFDNQFPSTIQTGQLVLSISNQLNLDPAVVYHSFVVFLSFVSGLYLLRLFRGRDPVFLIFISLLTHSMLFMPSSGLVMSFGQREHLLAIVFLPYVLDSFMNRSGGAVRYSFLLLTCWFATTKPQYSIFIVAVEVFSSLMWRHIKFGALALALLVPFLPFLILYIESPGSFRAFFSDLIPFYLNGGYQSFASRYVTRFYDKADWLILPVCYSIVAYRQAINEQKERIIFLSVLSLVSLAIVWQLGTFFYYHFMVFYACLGAVACYALNIIFGRQKIDSLALGILAFVIASNVYLNIGYLSTNLREYNQALAGDAVLEATRNQEVALIGGGVVIASTIEYNWELNNVLPWIFYLPMNYQYAFLFDSFRKNLGEYSNQVNERIQLKKPKTILVTLANNGDEKGYVMETMINYELLPALGNYSLLPVKRSDTNFFYRIYSRKEGE